MSVNVSILSTSDPACDAYVSQNPNAKICHLPAWGTMVERATSHKQLYLAARDNGRLCGVLPLTHIRSILFGNRMVSQGFSSYGGVLAENQNARDALFEFAVEQAKRLGCESIEFRNTEPLPYGLESRTGKICMYLALDPDPDKIWKSFPHQIRTHARKAEKSGLVARNGGLELLDDFYRVYTTRMHQLGSPAYPRKLIQSILQAFPENSRLFVVRLKKLVLSVALTTHFNGFAETPLGGTLVQYNNLCPNILAHWSIIRYYCLAGVKCFDFGRCTVGGPTYQFKKQWGPEPIDLHYQYWIRPGREVTVLSPDDPKYQKKVEMLKKLPFFMVRMIGPYISRNLV